MEDFKISWKKDSNVNLKLSYLSYWKPPSW